MSARTFVAATAEKRGYELTMFEDSMGSYKTNCSSVEDGLWHVNSARDHDGLPHFTLEEFRALLRGTDKGWVKMEPR